MFYRKPGDNSDFYKINIPDVILITLILFLSAGIFFSKAGPDWQSSENAEAFVYYEGRLINRLRLDREQELILADGKVIAETGQGKIRIRESDCPRRICVSTGWIKTPGQIIVCVPNKVLIEIKSGSPPFLDAVVK